MVLRVNLLWFSVDENGFSSIYMKIECMIDEILKSNIFHKRSAGVMKISITNNFFYRKKTAQHPLLGWAFCTLFHAFVQHVRVQCLCLIVCDVNGITTYQTQTYVRMYTMDICKHTRHIVATIAENDDPAENSGNPHWTDTSHV